MEDSILAITVLLGVEKELWFHHHRDSDCWQVWLWIKRN